MPSHAFHKKMNFRSKKDELGAVIPGFSHLGTTPTPDAANYSSVNGASEMGKKTQL